MTTELLDEANMKLLQASVDLITMGRQLEELKAKVSELSFDNKFKEAIINTLLGKLKRERMEAV